MTNLELADKAKFIAEKKKTLYVEGCFGSPLNPVNRIRYIRNHVFNANPMRTEKITNAKSDVYGFSSGGLIKALCWGWNDVATHMYGGAGYSINEIPDVSEDLLFNRCSNISTDMSMIQVGEVVWSSDRLGIYVGNGTVVTADHHGKDGVQFTDMDGVEGRYPWCKHAMLPGINYLGD